MRILNISLWMGMFVTLAVFLPFDDVYAQGQTNPAPQDTSNTSAQVDEIIGQEREVVFTEAITAQPARPLIQFSHIRPAVNFSEVRVGPSSRNFSAELRRGVGMGVGSPVIDVWEMFPNLIP